MTNMRLDYNVQDNMIYVALSINNRPRGTEPVKRGDSIPIWNQDEVNLRSVLDNYFFKVYFKKNRLSKARNTMSFAFSDRRYTPEGQSQHFYFGKKGGLVALIAHCKSKHIEISDQMDDKLMRNFRSRDHYRNKLPI